MTSIRKAKKRLKRGAAMVEELIAEYEQKPATFESCFWLDALRTDARLIERKLNQLKKKTK